MVRVGLTSTLVRGAEFSRRSLSLLAAKPGWVVPGGTRSAAEPAAILILQRGPNPSTDYYLRPRLPAGLPWRVASLDADPSLEPWLCDGRPLWVVVCRYVNSAWLRALETAAPARLSFFADDDLPSMATDPALPRSVRGKVAAHYSRHVKRLSALATDVWVSTPVLAARHGGRAVEVLPPVPEADPPRPEAGAPPLVVYHGSDVHASERGFVLEVARRLAAASPKARVEVTGDDRLRAAARDLPNLSIVDQASWPDYLAAQAGRRAAVFLAPLGRSAVNDARAPVKAFDAARLGAAAVFADAPAYRGWVRPGVDGLLAPMSPDAFAEATVALLRDEPRRLALATAAAERLTALRRSVGALPGASA